MSKASEYAKKAKTEQPVLNVGGIMLLVAPDGDCQISSQAFGFKFSPADALQVSDWIRTMFIETP